MAAQTWITIDQAMAQFGKTNMQIRRIVNDHRLSVDTQDGEVVVVKEEIKKALGL